MSRFSRIPRRWPRPETPWIWPHAQADCDQTRLIVILDDDGLPDHEVCPVCGREFW